MSGRFVTILAGGALVIGAIAGVMYLTSQPPAPPPAAAPTPTASTPAATPKPTSEPAASPKPAATTTPTPTPEPSPTTGTLVILSDVPDTSVFIDRVYLGTAPVTAADIKPGQHQLRMSASGYDGYAETIDVTPGTRTISIKFKEVRLDASLAVVHKHAIGSCTGTLRATPQGLTYQTDNKADAFTAPLLGLDTFTVDYLEKNLRVKIKNGKTFNFTDPDGKPDRLYLFHEEVEKARKRLAGK